MECFDPSMNLHTQFLGSSLFRWGAALGIVLAIGIWAQLLIRRGIGIWSKRNAISPHGRTIAAGVGFAAKALVWTLLLLTLLSSLGVKVSALIAGLGIGGVALALAVQSLLGDMFASISMYFDSPFDIGDSVAVTGASGRVERIGWRSTRIRASSGEEITLSNGELLKQPIHNFSRAAQQEVQCTLCVGYATRSELVEHLPALLADIITRVEGARFQRAYLKELGKAALEFELSFTISGDGGDARERLHAVNLAIFRRFEREGIAFAAAEGRQRTQRPRERIPASNGARIGH